MTAKEKLQPKKRRVSSPDAQPRSLKSALKGGNSQKPRRSQDDGSRTNAKLVQEKTHRLDKGKAKADPVLKVGETSGLKATGSPSLPSIFKVVVGSYERLLYGLEGSFETDKDSTSGFKLSLKPIFIFPAHVACVKAVAASPDGGKWLATGSADEIVKVWDLKRKKEIGGLVQHEGSVTHLSFPSRSHLVSASEDGTICIFRARDWVLLRSLKGHKGRVNSVAVHPSGKVALSVGKDNTLRMWDLMRGKGSASTKLGKEGEVIRWSAKGDKFVVQSGKTLDIYATDMSLLKTLSHRSRVHDVLFCRHPVQEDLELLLVAGEDKKTIIYNYSGGDDTTLPILGELTGHQNRVKAVSALSVALPAGSSRQLTTLIGTISSDGFVLIFDLASLPHPASESVSQTESKAEPHQLSHIADYDTKGSRLTCMTLADGEVSSTTESTTGKRKLNDRDDGVVQDDSEDGAWGGISDDADEASH